MNRAGKFVVAAALGLGAAGGWMAAVPAGAAAQPQPQEQDQQRHERWMPGRHIEGRIAFLKAELKITPAQEAMWERLAAAMRSSAGQMDQFMQQHKPDAPPANAMERLDRRAQFAALHANATQSVAQAFKPLYASLSDEQKKVADELVGRPMHGGMHHRHHHREPMPR